MFTLKLGLLLCIAFCLSTNAKFPNEPKPCKYGDTDCISKIIEYFLSEKYQGDGAINLVRMDPLDIKEIKIKQGAESAVNVDLEFNKNKIYGLRNAKVSKVKGFGKDMVTKHDVFLNAAQLDLAGNYKINGKILILPIVGSGTSNITLYNVNIRVQFTGKPAEKEGGTYMQLDKYHFDLEPHRMHFKIDNLFNGDKQLGDNMNLFLNENWEDIYRELKVSITSAFGQIFKSVITHVFSKYPYEKYFTE